MLGDRDEGYGRTRDPEDEQEEDKDGLGDRTEQPPSQDNSMVMLGDEEDKVASAEGADAEEPLPLPLTKKPSVYGGIFDTIKQM